MTEAPSVLTAWSTTTPLSIPVIDISPYLTDPASPQTSEIVATLKSASQSPGFFQITGHGISASLQKALLAKSAEFFALPVDKKNRIHRKYSSAGRGFETVGDQHVDGESPDQKEGFSIGSEFDVQGKKEGFLRGPNMWPDEQDCPGLKDTYLKYFEAMRILSRDVFRLIALSLDLQENYFDEFSAGEEAISLCRVNRYPPTTPEMAQKLRGIGAHTDFGALTLLLQDEVGGLEVFHEKSQTWSPVRPRLGTYVVNIGDMLQRWTNGKYVSTRHRAHSPTSGVDRYSVAFFNDGVTDRVLESIPSCLKAGEQSSTETITAEEHLRRCFAKSY